MKPGQELCFCGKWFWRAQKWMHEKCESTTKNVANTVVDTARKREAAVVDARTGDRHRKTAERREYLRLAQRRSRAARRASEAKA